MRDAEQNNWIEITTEIDPNTETEQIVVLIDNPKRQQRFIVDPQTRLPTRFETLRDDDPMELMRQTLWVKHLFWIQYNQQPPEGLFDLPEDAEIVATEVETLVDPDNGLIVANQTYAQACLDITQQAGQALKDLDRDTLLKLTLTFRIFPAEIWDKFTQMKAAGQWVEVFKITGDPYQEGDLWYVPAQIVYAGGKVESNSPMIKFFELNGRTHAYIIGSKEKGMVD